MVFLSKTLSALFAVAALAFLASPVAATNRQLCSPGYYSNDGYTPCNKCTAGTYTSVTGAKKCEDAEAGKSCGGEGSTGQTVCQPGTYSPSRSSSCISCPKGSYCPNQQMTQPTLCPPGYYTDKVGQRSCSGCPKGSFTSIYGAQSCCACPPGWFGENAASRSCSKCPKKGPYNQGYSPAGSTCDNDCVSRSGALTDASQSSDGTCPATVAPPSATQKTRRHHARSYMCKLGYKRCPVVGARGLKTMECVDVTSDLESCGGCVDNDSFEGAPNASGGRDCSAIPNVDTVKCSTGSCLIEKCVAGFKVSSKGDSCVAA